MKTIHNKKAKNKHEGSDFDDFLKEEGIYEEVCAAAAKRVIAAKLAEAIKSQSVTIATLARRMHTSPAAVHRLLDKKNTSVTLQSMEKAARAVGKRWEFKLVAA